MPKQIPTLDLQIPGQQNLPADLINDFDRVLEEMITKVKMNGRQLSELSLEAASALASADARQSELSSKGFVRRLLGELTGSNERLRSAIAENQSLAQYAAQKALVKLSEQNLLTLETVCAISARLTAYMTQTDTRLMKWVNATREMFIEFGDQLKGHETRIQKLETNDQLENYAIKIKRLRLVDQPLQQSILKITRNIAELAEFGKQELNQNRVFKVLDVIDPKGSATISFRELFEVFANQPDALTEFLGDSELFLLTSADNICDVFLLSLQKWHRLRTTEAYVVETILSELQSQGINKNLEDVLNSLHRTYCVKTLNLDLDKPLNLLDLFYSTLNSLNEYESIKSTLPAPAEASKTLPPATEQTQASNWSPESEIESVFNSIKDPDLRTELLHIMSKGLFKVGKTYPALIFEFVAFARKNPKVFQKPSRSGNYRGFSVSTEEDSYRIKIPDAVCEFLAEFLAASNPSIINAFEKEE